MVFTNGPGFRPTVGPSIQTATTFCGVYVPPTGADLKETVSLGLAVTTDDQPPRIASVTSPDLREGRM
jgi:hypothetical protein